MAQSRSTNFLTTSTSFIVPAGVTEVLVQPIDGTGVPVQTSSTITVIPGMTYSITINSTSWVYNNPNTLGSIYSWSGSPGVILTWIE